MEFISMQVKGIIVTAEDDLVAELGQWHKAAVKDWKNSAGQVTNIFNSPEEEEEALNVFRSC